MALPIYTAPPNTGEVFLGRTLPSLLDEACDRCPNPRAFNLLTDSGWVSFSTQNIRVQSEEIAAGLLEIGLQRGDHVAFFMENDAYFCIADMGCLISGMVDVPIYLTYGAEITSYVIEHSESKAIYVTNMELFKKTAPLLKNLPLVKYIFIADCDENSLKEAKTIVSEDRQVFSQEELRTKGRVRIEGNESLIGELKAKINCHDVASIIYTSGTTGPPKGVVLTHENISSNILTCFNGLEYILKRGAEEVIVSFLPLTHIFARTITYGHLNYGHTTYFSNPDQIGEHFKELKPTMLSSVPRVLEKVYNKIVEKGHLLTGLKKALFFWALGLGQKYQLGTEPTGFYATQLRLANKLIFSKWREALGGRVKFIVTGGAATRADLANIFSSAEITILQGYGLTETSPVISFNRGAYNRAGTIGIAIPGVEVSIAEDGEILSRGPHIMKGYYRNPEATAEVIDSDGWFHTGDIGEVIDGVYLVIKDRKKDLFKLSTGKYVMPQPLEISLMEDPLIEQAVVIGDGRQFCGALLFPNVVNLKNYAAFKGINSGKSVDELLADPIVLDHYERKVAAANQSMPPWSQVKKFRLINGELTQDNGVLTPSMKVRRSKVKEIFAKEIDGLYEE